MSTIDPLTASAEIDLSALQHNLAAIAEAAAPAALMLVVKADGYGHGMVPCARAARAAGVPWLGVATPGEAIALRDSGDAGPLLCWLYGVDEDLAPLVERAVDVSVSSLDALGAALVAAAEAGRPVRVQLKADTGLSRNGCPPADWPALCEAAAQAEATGVLSVVGVWSHLAAADEPGHPANDTQLEAFRAALAVAEAAGLRPEVRHLANSAAALTLPPARFDLVRVGIAAYGVDPAPGIAALAGLSLRPVMRLRATLAAAKDLAAGDGVSYGHTWHAGGTTRVGLVPLGYADGVPRHASSRAEVYLDTADGGRRVPIRGRVCMDQFVVEAPGGRAGDEVTLFGAAPAPSVADWARWCDTIGYEIVTRIGSRVPRRYEGGAAADHG